MAWGQTGPAHNLGRCHLSGPGEGAAEAQVPWFPRSRTAPPGTAGTPRGPGPARAYPEPASHAGGQRAGAGPKRTAGSREAAAAARRPAPNFYPSARWPPPARHLHTGPPASRRRRAGSPRAIPEASGRGPSSPGEDTEAPSAEAASWRGAGEAALGLQPRDVGERKGREDDREERERRRSRGADTRLLLRPPASPLPHPHPRVSRAGASQRRRGETELTRAKRRHSFPGFGTPGQRRRSCRRRGRDLALVQETPHCRRRPPHLPSPRLPGAERGAVTLLSSTEMRVRDPCCQTHPRR